MIYSFNEFSPSVDDSAFIAPGSAIIGHVITGSESSIWFNSVIRGDINSVTIGKQTNIQDGCLLHVTHQHSIVVDDRVKVGHGAILHGCSIGSECLIAMGAVVLDGAFIGS